MQCLSFDLLTPESPSTEAPCEEMNDEDTDDLTSSVCKDDGAAPLHHLVHVLFYITSLHKKLSFLFLSNTFCHTDDPLLVEESYEFHCLFLKRNNKFFPKMTCKEDVVDFSLFHHQSN